MSPFNLTSLLRLSLLTRRSSCLHQARVGFLTRKEAGEAAAAKSAVTCLRNQSVADLQARLIESNSMVVVLLDRPPGSGGGRSWNGLAVVEGSVTIA